MTNTNRNLPRPPLVHGGIDRIDGRHWQPYVRIRHLDGSHATDIREIGKPVSTRREAIGIASSAARAVEAELRGEHQVTS